MPSRKDWEQRWQARNTPWDIRGVTPALVAFCRSASLKRKKVLVPGCGQGHDAHFLSKRGADVVALDFSEHALAQARASYPDSRVNWQCRDVTCLDDEARFDFVWEYTCFCALDPDLRIDYLANMAKALKPEGLFFGMVFQTVPKPDGPPFAIEPEAFRQLLAHHFRLLGFEAKTERSLKARAGSEIWFEAIAKGPL